MGSEPGEFGAQELVWDQLSKWATACGGRLPRDMHDSQASLFSYLRPRDRSLADDLLISVLWCNLNRHGAGPF